MNLWADPRVEAWLYWSAESSTLELTIYSRLAVAGWAPRKYNILISAVVSILLASSVSGTDLRVDGQAVLREAVFQGRHVVSVGGASTEIDGDVVVKHGLKGYRVVAHIQVEDYVAAALESEAQEFQAPEALKAMAVAVRSYVAANSHKHGADADLCDGTHCQRLRFPASSRMRQAAEDTRSEIVWYDKKPAQVYYHQNCGGATASVASVWGGQGLPYLVSRRDPFCERRPGSWQAQVTKERLTRVLARSTIPEAERPAELRILGHNTSGRVSIVQLGTKTWTGARFRELLSGITGQPAIRSARFSVIESGDHYTFFGRGAGHGVGLCQHGTVARAEAGQGYRQILAAYFPGTRVSVE